MPSPDRPSPRPPSATVVHAACWACDADVCLPEVGGPGGPPPPRWACDWCGAVTEGDGRRARGVAASLARTAGRGLALTSLACVAVAVAALVAHILPALFGGVALWLADAAAVVMSTNVAAHAAAVALAPPPRHPPPPRRHAPGRVPHRAYEGYRWCAPCGDARAVGARHCSACGVCVPAAARHCAFTGACVPPAGPAARHFVLMLAWLGVGAATGGALCAATLAARRGEVAAVLAGAPPRRGARPRAAPLSLLAAMPAALLTGPPWLPAAACVLGACVAAAAAVAAVAADAAASVSPLGPAARRLFGGGHPVTWLLPPFGGEEEEKRE